MSLGSGLFAKALAAIGHLARPGGGLAGELFDLRRDVARTFEKMMALTVEEFTNPAAADPDGIMLAAATSTSASSFVYADLDGALVSSPSPYARNLSVTNAGNTPADAPATVTFTGLYRGKPQTETINVPQTATSAVTTKPFDLDTAGLKALTISMPVGQGTDTTLSFGTGDGIGVTATPKSRAGGVVIVREIVDGSLVTNGALTATGLYTPNTAPNGAHDYAACFEFTPAVDISYVG